MQYEEQIWDKEQQQGRGEWRCYSGTDQFRYGLAVWTHLGLQMVRVQRGYATPCSAICLETAWKLLETARVPQWPWPKRERRAKCVPRWSKTRCWPTAFLNTFIWKMSREQVESGWPLAGIRSVSSKQCLMAYRFVFNLSHSQWDKSIKRKKTNNKCLCETFLLLILPFSALASWE